MVQTITPVGVVKEASARAKSVLSDVQERWNEAALTWDVAGLTAMYTPDAVMYGGRPGMSVGHTGMHQYFSSYIDMLASTKLDLTDQVMIELAPNVYLSQGYGVFQFQLKSGKKSGTTMRTTLVLVERDNEWKILQHHFSLTPDEPPVPQ
jgi:uncharacterized protein (TIGR02246 family)